MDLLGSESRVAAYHDGHRMVPTPVRLTKGLFLTKIKRLGVLATCMEYYACLLYLSGICVLECFPDPAFRFIKSSNWYVRCDGFYIK